MTTPIDKDLRALAEAATQGEWRTLCDKSPDATGVLVGDEPHQYQLFTLFRGDHIDETVATWKRDAAFIAAANPATVLELIAEVERLREVVKADDQLRAGTAVRSTTVDSQMIELAARDDELSQLKAERDRMAEALGLEAGEIEKNIPHVQSVISGEDAIAEIEAVAVRMRICADRHGRSALNTGEKDG